MTITTSLVSSEHGFDDFDVQGLPMIHRACVGHGIKKGDIFNVYCGGGGIKLGGTWQGTLERSLSAFATSHPGYLELLEAIPSSGEVGRHDWCIGAGCEDGYPVFVDDRQLSYRPTPKEAMAYALEIIARLDADGDYRLNDRPTGFLPPPLPVAGDPTTDQELEEHHEGFSIGDSVRVKARDGEWIIAAILLSERGQARNKPFHLRPTERNDAEGFPTRYGTIPTEEHDRHVWIWAAANELSLSYHDSQG